MRTMNRRSTAFALTGILAIGGLTACEDNGGGINDDVEQEIEEDLEDVEQDVEDGVDNVGDEVDGDPDDGGVDE